MAPANLIINYDRKNGLTNKYIVTYNLMQTTSLRVIVIVIIRQFLSLLNSLVSLKSFAPGPRMTIGVGHNSKG